MIAPTAIATALAGVGIDIGLRALTRIPELWRSGRSNSLIDITREVRVEPNVLMDSQCVLMDITPEVMQTMLSLFTAYYLQAASLMMTVGGISVRKRLDPLNPNRSAADAAIDAASGTLQRSGTKFLNDTRSRWGVSMENLQDGLPNAKKAQERAQGVVPEFDEIITDQSNTAGAETKIREAERNYALNREKFDHQKAMDMAKQELEKAGLELDREKFAQIRNSKEFAFGRDTLATVKDLSNLAVGKIFNLELKENGDSAQVPITVRLQVKQVPTHSLVHILSGKTGGHTMKELWHGWRSGELDMIKDVIMANDLIDARRRLRMEDPDGIIKDIVNRKRQNQLAGLLSGNMSVATASNIAIMAATTATELESKIAGRLRDFKTRQKVFDSSSLMLICVIDQKWDKITIYHRGLQNYTQVTSRDLKAGGSKGPDVSDILKAYMVGQSPTL